MTKSITVDGIEYVPKSEQSTYDDKNYVIVRGDRSGVFAGYLKEENGRTVILDECRNIWYWSGAASVSELAMKGVSKPEECKFPAPTYGHKVVDVIEIIPATIEARKNIQDVWIWTKHGCE